MYRRPTKQFKVVQSKRQHYAVWHEDAPMESAWREAGYQGTVVDCWNFIQAAEGQIGWIMRLPPGSS